MSDIHSNTTPTVFNAVAGAGITAHPKKVQALTDRIAALVAWAPEPINQARTLADTENIGETLAALAERDAIYDAYLAHGGPALTLLLNQREQAIRDNADFYISRLGKLAAEHATTLTTHAPHLLDGVAMLDAESSIGAGVGDHLTASLRAAGAFTALADVIPALVRLTDGNRFANAAATLVNPGRVSPQIISASHGRRVDTTPPEDQARRVQLSGLIDTMNHDKTLCLIRAARGEFGAVTIGLPGDSGEYRQRAAEFGNLYARTA